MVKVQPSPAVGRALIIHQLPLVGFAEVFALLCRLGFNDPPTAVGGIPKANRSSAQVKKSLPGWSDSPLLSALPGESTHFVALSPENRKFIRRQLYEISPQVLANRMHEVCIGFGRISRLGRVGRNRQMDGPSATTTFIFGRQVCASHSRSKISINLSNQKGSHLVGGSQSHAAGQGNTIQQGFGFQISDFIHRH
jgi:hypothetical protein